MILDIDFLQTYKESIKIGNGTISFYEGGLETLKFLSLSTPTPAHTQNDKIKTANSVILKPRSQTCIMVKVPESYDGQEVLIEPTKGPNKFMSAKSLDIFMANTLPVCCSTLPMSPFT